MPYTLPITYSKTTDFTDTIDEVDALSCMETFTFPNLKEVKTSLQKSKYSEEQINEVIAGLKTLSEYKRG